jgi:hypothetical protein
MDNITSIPLSYLASVKHASTSIKKMERTDSNHKNCNAYFIEAPWTNGKAIKISVPVLEIKNELVLDLNFLTTIGEPLVTELTNLERWRIEEFLLNIGFKNEMIGIDSENNSIISYKIKSKTPLILKNTFIDLSRYKINSLRVAHALFKGYTITEYMGENIFVVNTPSGFTRTINQGCNCREATLINRGKYPCIHSLIKQFYENNRADFHAKNVAVFT